MSTPFFMTHHAPVGAWSSFTFGLPGRGVGIEHESLKVEATGDLLVAVSRGPGKVQMLPFIAGLQDEDYEGRVAGNANLAAFKQWAPIAPKEITRRLTPATDEFRGGDLCLRVISPRFPLPDPETEINEAAFKAAICPALIIEVEVDNTRHTVPACGFIGLAYQGKGRLRPLDWSGDGKLCGVALGDAWALAALGKTGSVFTIRSGSVAPFVEAGAPVIHPGGNEGGIAFAVPAGQRATLTCAVGFHHAGNGTHGIQTRYAFSDFFADVESVCRYALESSGTFKLAAQQSDEKSSAGGVARQQIELLAQASQGYYANSSLLRDARGGWRWSVCEGQFAWRNTLDLAADHLPFELRQHPWVARNVMDSFFDRYAYRDQVTFAGEGKKLFPGGISFAHDQGNYTSYAPAGQSGYEQPNRDGLYSFMTGEQLLNGIYCAAAYALASRDRPWSGRRKVEAVEMLRSLQNRDHHDPAKRNGWLKGESDRVGNGAEITTYDALDHVLQNASGNLYIAVKTWCSALMLGELLELAGENSFAAEARAMAQKAAESTLEKFDHARGQFPPNLFAGGDALVIAALEPLAVPLYCGMSKQLQQFPRLLAALQMHARSALQPGVCLDAATGGLRLSSTSPNTWVSKCALTFFVIEWLEAKAIKLIAPLAMRELAAWMQVSAAEGTVADQIQSGTRQAIGGFYYPRCVTLSLLLGGEAAKVLK